MRRFFLLVLLFGLIGLYLAGCHTGEDRKTGTYSYELVDAGIVRFPLDTTQSFYFKYIQYDSLRDQLYLFNNYNNSIYYYKYSSRSFERKVLLETEGPNGVGPTYRMGFNIHGDTAYLMNYKTSRIIKWVNGKVMGKVDLMPQKFEEEGLPEATVFNPILFHDRKLEIITQSVDPREDNTRLTNLIIMDIYNDSVKRVVPRPALYNQGYWGLFNLYRVSHALNIGENKDVFCFPASPELLIYDAQTKSLTGNALVSSDYFDNENIKPVKGVSAKEALNFMNYKKEKAQKHDLMTSHYGPLYYDRYRNIYYLLTNIGLTSDEYNDPDMRNKYPMKHSIIVLDNQFKKLTEFMIPRYTLFVGGMLVTKDGLLISNSGEYAKDENTLPFTILSLIKKN